MQAIESVISLIITLGILVTIHEYGHYWVAKRCGVKVLRFSVGFGRALYTWRNREGTEFCIAAIPLGGYVKMLDEREAPVDEGDKPLAFNNKPVGQRIAIASAGPIANFIFAVFAYWLMFMMGYNVVKPIIGEVEKDSIAYEAGVSAGQEVKSLGGRPVDGWRDLGIALVNYVGDSTTVDLHAREENGAAHQYYLKLDNWLLNEEPGNLIESIGIVPLRPHIPATLETIVAQSPAQSAGLLSGDTVVEADGEKIGGWFDLVRVIERSPAKEIGLDIERPDPNGGFTRMTVLVIPNSIQTEKGDTVGRLGVGPAPFKYPEDMIRTVQHGPVDAMVKAADQTWADVTMTLNAIRKMVVGLLSLANLSGPITIAQVASQSISSGAESFLSFLALLSVSLGVLNLLPIPVLDGGHILYYVLEGIRGKPIPESWQVIGLKIGLTLVFSLMAIAFYNDIMRL